MVLALVITVINNNYGILHDFASLQNVKKCQDITILIY